MIFDLDGTLADTSRDLIEAANHTFDTLGITERLDPLADRMVAFSGGKALLGLGLGRQHPDTDNSDAIDRHYFRFLESYSENIAVHTRPYDRAFQALERLNGSGWRLGVCTNKPEGLAASLLDSLEMTGFFQALVGADTYPYRKPDPRALLRTIERIGGDPARSFLVGDSQTDFLTAERAGAHFILHAPEAVPDLRSKVCPESQMVSYGDLPVIAERLWERMMTEDVFA